MPPGIGFATQTLPWQPYEQQSASAAQAAITGRQLAEGIVWVVSPPS
jgi:hypothetical protein